MEERRISGLSASPTHNIIMENRSKASISGVEDVDSFDEQSVVLYTSAGLLTVQGRDFHINKLNVESGEVVIEGDIESLTYSEAMGRAGSGGGFFAKLFK